MAMLTFEDEFTVYRHDGDCFGYVRPASILRYVQQVSTLHAYKVGLTDEIYARTHTAYLMAKLALHFDRLPHVDEVLTLRTQPEGLKRAVNKRITTISGADGVPAAVVDARWVLVDTDKRMILRKHPPEFDIARWADDVPCELPMKMRKVPLEQTETEGEYAASYSRCDMNGHMNNTRYVDIICDALPWTVWEQNTISDLLIFYHKEVRRGEGLTLHRARLDENSWYFAGWSGDHSCFEAEITLKKREE